MKLEHSAAAVSRRHLVGQAPERLRSCLPESDGCYHSDPEPPWAIQPRTLAEMLELGHWAGPSLRDAQSRVAERGIHVLVGSRGAGGHPLGAVQRAGLRAGAAFFFGLERFLVSFAANPRRAERHERGRN